MILKLLASTCLISSFILPLQANEKPAVNAEDLHFMEYRVLLIESSAMYINEILDDLVANDKIPTDAANDIRQHVAWMLFNAGCYDLKRSGN